MHSSKNRKISSIFKNNRQAKKQSQVDNFNISLSYNNDVHNVVIEEKKVKYDFKYDSDEAAMNLLSLSTDEPDKFVQLLFNIMSKKKSKERHNFVVKYNAKYDKSVKEMLVGLGLPTSTLNLCSLLLNTSSELHSHQLYTVLWSKDTSKETLRDVIIPITDTEKATQQYKLDYDRDVIQDILEKVDKEYAEYLMLLLTNERIETKTHDIEYETNILLSMDKDSTTDFLPLFLATRTFSSINAMARQIQSKSQRSLIQIVENVFESLKDIYITIILYSLDPTSYYVNQLIDCIKPGSQIDETRLNILLVNAMELNLVTIATSYRQERDRFLSADILTTMINAPANEKYFIEQLFNFVF